MFDLFQCRWRNQEIEKDVAFAQKVIKNIRSARATYNLPNKTKTEAFVTCNDAVLKDKIVQYKLLKKLWRIRFLAWKSHQQDVLSSP